MLPKSALLQILLMVLSLFLSGCAVKKVPRLDVKHAWIVSNNERYELKFPGKRELLYLQPYQRKLHLTGGSDLLLVDFGLRQILLWPKRKKLNITFNDSESFYQSNNNRKEPLELSVGVSEILKSQYYHATFKQPDTLRHITPTARGELLEKTVKWIKSNDDIVHRYYFAFDIDGIPYAIDIAFRLEVETIREIGVPATP